MYNATAGGGNTAPTVVNDDLECLSAPKMGHAGENILVIDDDDGVRTFVVESLESLGYSVRAAPDGSAGLALIKSGIPDLLLVDFAMPGMTGVDVIKAVQKIKPALPTILATGYAETDSIDQVAGPIRVLRKPFQIDQLAGVIQDLLEKHR